ncbi:MAG: DUF1294 domain-containing protein [Coprococcus sp.]|nr:DUF1294 domain-containing protein [Coprococcus sp.]
MILCGIFAIYMILINMAAFYMFGLDKRKAKAGRSAKNGRSAKKRIPEKVLLGVAAAGGAAGSLIGMKVYRHKTSKRKFYLGVPMLLVLQCLLVLFLLARL